MLALVTAASLIATPPLDTADPAPVPTTAAAAASPRNALVIAEPLCLGAPSNTCGTLPYLLRAQLSSNGFQIRRAAGNVPCADAGCATQVGRESGADWVVTLQVTRLDAPVLVDVTLVETATGRIEYAERARVIAAADLDPLSIRLARAIAERMPFASTLTPQTVTHAEARPWPVRRRPAVLVGLQLGGLTPIGGYHGVPYLSGGELTGWLEVDRWLVGGALGAHHGQDGERRVNESYADVGLYRLLGDGEVAPFAGAGVGLHGFAYSDGTRDETEARIWEERSGNAVWAGGGVMLLRSTHVHVFLLGKYSVDLFSIDGPVPHGLTLSAGAAMRF